MVDSSYFREKAEQCFRLARDSTDPTVVKSLTEMAIEYAERANAIEALAFRKDP
jgi:hypothetical protein